MTGSLPVLLIALIADRKYGEPDLLWSRMPHPVVLFGRAIGWADRSFNLDSDEDALRYRKGSFVIAGLVLASVFIGWLLQAVFGALGFIGLLPEAFAVFVLLAQKSLIDHVQAVANGLREDGIEGGRKAVSLIVGRDPSSLDGSSVCRAAIETLGENFSDAVVAPAFWYIVFGLPGLFAYKMINTADSMIGYRSERHEHFGKTSAKLDDLANWVPARLSAGVIVAATVVIGGFSRGRAALDTAMQDAGLHRSPNAGWPEAALAGACGFALGGPRNYGGETVAQAYMNASGKRDLGPPDIASSITVVGTACTVLAIFVAVVWIIL